VLAIFAYNVPRISELLAYDRRAILDGELWRILTAPVVHFSASHLFWDAVVFGAAGVAVNASGFRGLWHVCALGTIIPGLAYLLWSPDLGRYGGLSGPATGAVAYYCLFYVCQSKKHKMVRLVILAGTGIKIIAEIASGAPVFAHAESIPFRVLPSAHFAGLLGAVTVFLWFRHKNSPG
jgi:rhomboid family GlyGly-CTERM serine protease